jgi:NADH:ubiquinone oxidoreductase subunit H
MQIHYYINQDLAITVDLSYSILFQLFLSSLSVFALIIAGYASHSRYSLIGSLRSGVQVLCYELVIGVVSLVVILVTNTLSYSSFIAYHTIIISPYGNSLRFARYESLGVIFN